MLATLPALLASLTLHNDVLQGDPLVPLAAVPEKSAVVHGRSLATYSWLPGNPEAVYGVPYHSGLAHTHGGKKALIIKFKQTGASCTDCSTVMSDSDLDSVVAAGNASLYANSYGKAWLAVVTVVPTVVTVDPGLNFFRKIDAVRQKAYELSTTYNYELFDFDLIWKRKESSESAGGSAVVLGAGARSRGGGSAGRSGANEAPGAGGPPNSQRRSRLSMAGAVESAMRQALHRRPP